MRNHSDKDKSNNGIAEIDDANYHGLVVRLIVRMEECSVIRYQNRDFIVDTQDLRFARWVQCAAA